MGAITHKIEISGEHLTTEKVAAVSREKIKVKLSQDHEVRQRIFASCKLLEEKLERGEIIYGVNTGFGSNVRFLIPQKELARHQENLFQYLICGTGPPLPVDTVLASILLRANALAKGYSGVRLAVIERPLATWISLMCCLRILRERS